MTGVQTCALPILFLFAIILLVTASNIMILFVGWEGVGLCSFLLIGFWFKNVDYNKAARKAFVMNRIGDLGFFWKPFLDKVLNQISLSNPIF